MVRKNSKAGLHTGNTIRLPGGHPFLKKLQTYGYFVTEANDMDRNQRRCLKDLISILPSPNGSLQYSMNKKRRWDLPRLLNRTLIQQSDNPGLLMRVMEHTMHIGQTEDEHKRFCSSYLANQGGVLEKRSHSEMNMKSAMQAYLESDHMSKKERRQFLKQASLCAPAFTSATGEEKKFEDKKLPSYDCHIVHGATTNGKLYKELQTRGILITHSSSKLRHGTSGCTKANRAKIYEDDMYVEPDYDFYDAYDAYETAASIPLDGYIHPTCERISSVSLQELIDRSPQPKKTGRSRV